MHTDTYTFDLYTMSDVVCVCERGPMRYICMLRAMHEIEDVRIKKARLEDCVHICMCVSGVYAHIDGLALQHGKCGITRGLCVTGNAHIQ